MTQIITKPSLAIGADHAGYNCKQNLLAWLSFQGYSLRDFGTNSANSVDYPDFAHPVALAVEEAEAHLGILICGSGNGVAMAANKHPNIRAALCWNEETAALARQHNHANVLCLGARLLEDTLIEKIVHTFLTTKPEVGRHLRRVQKIPCAKC